MHGKDLDKLNLVKIGYDGLILVKDMLENNPSINWALLIFLNFNFYFTTCFNPEQGPVQVILPFEPGLNLVWFKAWVATQTLFIQKCPLY